jgi:hypothetical protein
VGNSSTKSKVGRPPISTINAFILPEIRNNAKALEMEAIPHESHMKLLKLGCV